MHSLQSDTDSNTMCMAFSGEVTVANLARLERRAVVAARVLDRDFVLVTDVTDCTQVTESAIECIESVVDQLGQFGLTREVRIVEETTPEQVTRQFDCTETNREVAVNIVDADNELIPAVAEKALS